MVKFLFLLYNRPNLILLLLFLPIVAYAQPTLEPWKEEPYSLTLKCNKSKIILYREFEDIKIGQDGKTIEYAKKVSYMYPGDEALAKTFKGQKEILSRRQPRVEFYREGLTKDNKIKMAGKFYGGDRYYYDESDNKWYDTQYDIMKLDDYKDQTALTIGERILEFFGKTVYAARVASSAGDGHVMAYPTAYCTEAGFHDARDAAIGDAVFYTSTYVTAGSWCEVGWVRLVSRAFFPIDTSGIGAGRTITSGKFHAYTYSIQPYPWVTTYDIRLVPTTQASPTELVLADYVDCGHVDCTTQLADDIQANYGWMIFTLDDADGDVDKTGWTYLGIREVDHDCADVYNVNIYELRVYSSEIGYVDYRPYLEAHWVRDRRSFVVQ
jgi:hypothetical protein